MQCQAANSRRFLAIGKGNLLEANIATKLLGPISFGEVAFVWGIDYGKNSLGRDDTTRKGL